MDLHGGRIDTPLFVQVSGTTATVAAVVGWDLVVASVGDSTAFLDTGAEVVQVRTASVHSHGIIARRDKTLKARAAYMPKQLMPSAVSLHVLLAVKMHFHI